MSHAPVKTAHATAPDPNSASFHRGLIEGMRCGILTIDLAALESNYKTLRSASTPAECAAVVKADGYGLGLEPVASHLAQFGCTTFFTDATLESGTRVPALVRI